MSTDLKHKYPTVVSEETSEPSAKAVNTAKTQRSLPDSNTQLERVRAFCDPHLLQRLQGFPARLTPLWDPSMRSRYTLEARECIVQDSLQFHRREEVQLTDTRDKLGAEYVQVCEKLAGTRVRKAELEVELSLIKHERAESAMRHGPLTP